MIRHATKISLKTKALMQTMILSLMILMLPTNSKISMSFYNELTELGIQLRQKSGQCKVVCPRCSETRKKKSEPCLSVDIDSGRYNCHNPGCDFSGGVKKFREKKTYTKPEWTNATSLSEKLVQYFKGRGISQRILIEEKISEGQHYMVQHEATVNTVQFPYFREGEIVNIKYRSGAKAFQMVKDAELIFYGLDGITNSKEAIIVEGEIDRLSYLEADIKSVVSVPNGASRGAQKLDYLDNCWEDFETKEKIYIATDNDEAGMALRDELVRRLGDERCYLINFKDCKDANEYLVKHGALALAETLTNARPVPIEGIWTADQLTDEMAELYKTGLPVGEHIGQHCIDDHISFLRGHMTTITGIPNHGKSDFLDHIIERLSVIHDWRFGIFSPENFPLSLHVSKLAEKLVGKRFHGQGRMSEEELNKALEFINEHFYFIRPKDENYTLENILEKGRRLVSKYGIHGLIIDPWNTIEHQIPMGISETNYISNQMAKLASFKQRYRVHVFIVAHPTKMKKDKGGKKYNVPTLYDIMGSAHFFNKTDNGFCVYRDFDNNITTIHFQKIKFKHMGKVGNEELEYDLHSGRYREKSFPLEESNHLMEKPKVEPRPEQVVMQFNPAENFGMPYSNKQEDELPF